MIDERELIRRAQKLIRRYDNMKIVGSRGEWSGNARQGFKFNPLDGSGGGGGGGGGQVIQTGACCLDGICSTTTQVACTLAGGTYMGNGTSCADQNCPSETSGACCVGANCSVTSPQQCDALNGVYQGDNSTCDPNPCTTTGACCDGDGNCSIQTQEDCQNAGGTYQGDNSTCDPNPCPQEQCLCQGFRSDLLPGRVFLTVETHGSSSQYSTGDCSDEFCGIGAICLFDLTCSGNGAVMSYNPITCELTDIAGTWHSINNARSTCECVDIPCTSLSCQEQSPQPTSSGSYHAGNQNFCGLDTGLLTYTVSGTTVHGHLDYTEDGEPCHTHSQFQFDVYHIFSNECIPV